MDNTKNKSPVPNFLHAIRGISYVFKTEQNARIHLIIALVVIILGILFNISHTEWLLVVLCIGMVITAEIINTAIERLVDIVSPQFNKKAGKVKDIAAGSVLLSVLAAVIIGLMIYIPYIIETFKNLFP